MAMPEASLDLNNRSVLWQDNIGASRQIADVQPESEPQLMECLSNKHLRLRVG